MSLDASLTDFEAAVEGSLVAIHRKTRAFDELERRHGLPVNQATANERLHHARQLLESVADAIDNDTPYRERMIALASHCTRWVDHLDTKASERPVNAPRRAPRPELVRRFLRHPPAAL